MIARNVPWGRLSLALLLFAANLGCTGSQTGKGTEPSSASQGGDTSSSARGGDTKTDAELLQGSWQCVSLNYGEDFMEAFKDHAVLVIDKDKFDISLMNIVGKTIPQGFGKFTLDPSKKPKTIDTTYIADAKTGQKEAFEYGIYELDQDTFKWCTTTRGKEDRPKEFTSGTLNGKDKAYSLWVFKRKK